MPTDEAPSVQSIVRSPDLPANASKEELEETAQDRILKKATKIVTSIPNKLNPERLAERLKFLSK